MNKTITIVSAAALLAACVMPPPNPDGSIPDSGGESLATGIVYLALSPLIVAGGLIQGIASLPYMLDTDVHSLNRSMEESGARVSLDQTYQSAYGQRLEQVPASGNTGKVFHYMSEATAYFQRVLRGYGVTDADHYVLTAVRSADRAGYTLYAVVARTPGRIESTSGRNFTPRDRAYYRPYQRDAGGRPVDMVIDWAGVPRTAIRTQKGQAILMTLAANSVLVNRRSDDYWEAQRRWLAGDFRGVVAERKRELDRRMGRAG